MGTEKTRKRIIDGIKASLLKATLDQRAINKKQLIAYLSLEEGVTITKSKEYIDTLIEAGFCREEEGNLFLNQTPEQKESIDDILSQYIGVS